MKLKPFDPADYLDTEEGIEAYLEDARAFGQRALADAEVVVARARARMAARASKASRRGADRDRSVEGQTPRCLSLQPSYPGSSAASATGWGA